MPLYDKPMIYYPLTTLMLSGIREILIISKKNDQEIFKSLLKDGSHLGLNISYEIQNEPNGIAESFIIGENFLDNHPVGLILGDNLFYGANLSYLLKRICQKEYGASLFGYAVNNPNSYGVVNFDELGNIIGIEEKPKYAKSNWAITGLYFYDETIVKKAKKLLPSSRGEIEITDINKMYLNEKKLNIELLGRGITWLDTGTIESLFEANNFVKTIQSSQRLKIGCPEEVSWRMGWIKKEEIFNLAKDNMGSGYGEYLISLVE